MAPAASAAAISVPLRSIRRERGRDARRPERPPGRSRSRPASGRPPRRPSGSRRARRRARRRGAVHPGRLATDRADRRGLAGVERACEVGERAGTDRPRARAATFSDVLARVAQELRQLGLVRDRRRLLQVRFRRGPEADPRVRVPKALARGGATPSGSPPSQDVPRTRVYAAATTEDVMTVVAMRTPVQVTIPEVRVIAEAVRLTARRPSARWRHRR